VIPTTPAGVKSYYPVATHLTIPEKTPNLRCLEASWNAINLRHRPQRTAAHALLPEASHSKTPIPYPAPHAHPSPPDLHSDQKPSPRP
jgi:hypothetical protein